MCGIAGKFYFNPQKAVPPGILEQMCQTLAHRGPDDQGIFVKGNIGLGHRRLAVIDLSRAGHQPMPDNEKKIWITYNGEIYNFLELKKELEKEGLIFKSKSDTEVIIYLYKKYGTDCLRYLRGMFAFAIWDEAKRQLFLARDRLGKKPLKYYLDDNVFIFASELKAILKNSEIKKEPDLKAIHHYLTFQYAPSPLTGFRGIKKLPPAHYMIVKENGQSEIKRYWKLDYSEKWDLSEREWKEKILEKLEESVKIRMISDVPLGAFLSGGIDSSAIVALMSHMSSKPIKTFSIGFEEKDYNELSYAQRIAKLFRTCHREFIVKADAIEILPKLAYYYEEPYADSSAIPTFYLSELTRKYVKVALNGDGGDENFAGYNRYNALKIFYLLQKLPKFSMNITQRSLALFSNIFFPRPKRKKVINFIKKLSQDPEKGYLQIISYFNEEEKAEIYTDAFQKKIRGTDSFEIVKEKFEEAGVSDFLDKIFYVDANLSLPEDLLVKMDIATMAHSLETRSPFLDHQFLELTAKIPSNLKLKGQNKKYILKKALKDILPKEILYRKKMGFGVPIEKWFRNELKDYIYQVLLSKTFLSREMFKKEAIKKILDNHIQRKENHAYQIWSLLFLEHWFREFFD